MAQIDSKSTIPEMLGKLDELYTREEDTENRIKALLIALETHKEHPAHQNISQHIRALLVLYEQLQEDIELGEQLIMYASNRRARSGAMADTGCTKK